MRKSQSSTRSRLAIAGLSTGVVLAAVLVAPQAAFAATTPTPTMGPASGTITVTDSGTPFATTIPTAAEFVTASSCPGTYTAVSATVVAATGVAKVDSSTATLTVPSALGLGTNGIAKPWNICFYVGSTAGTSATIATASLPSYTVQAVTTASPTTGASGGGNTVTVTAPTASAIFTGLTTPGAIVTTGACPSTFGSSPTGAATATRTSNTVGTVTIPATVLGTGPTATPYNVCLYANTGSTSSAVLLAATTYSVTLPTVTLSSVIGPTGGGNGITVTSTSNFLTGVTTPGVAFVTAATCPTTLPATASGVVQASGGAARKLANNRLAVTVPALPLTAAPAPTLYQACIYNGTTTGTSTILAAAAYTSTTVQTVTGVTPNAGPALGGSTITITGADFPTAAGSITATLGGTPLIVTPVSATAFTAVTPAHSVEDGVPLVVTTSAGSRTLQSAYSYNNALQLTPNTAPNTMSAVNMDILGTGFMSQTFGTATTNARVFLVDGVYNGAAVAANTRSNSAVAECGTVLVISDNELICTMSLSHRLDAVGTAPNTVVPFNSVTYSHALTTVNSAAGSKLINLTGTDTFTTNDVGQAIKESSVTNIPAGAIITSVLSPTLAMISANALLTSSSAFAATIGASAVHTFTTGITTTTGAAATTIVATVGSFTSADVGRVINGSAVASGIVNGTTITAISADGLSATISAPATVAATSQTMTLFPSAAVPNGAYTMTFVSNGDVDAASTDTTYTQSVISSDATFTVSPF